MKFKIIEDSYIFRDEDDDTISLMIKETSQIIYLNAMAKKILETSHDFCELKDFVKMLNLDSGTEKIAMKEFEELIYQLESFGILLISNKEVFYGEGCKVAGERDYADIANFIECNLKNQYSYSSITNTAYFNSISIRSRQFNNLEYNILKRKDEKILSDLIISMPASTSGLSVIFINGIIFDSELTEEKCAKILKEQIEYVLELFQNDFNKIRFQYFSKKQDWILNQFQKNGFIKICVFEKEIEKSEDLVIYDKIL